MEDLLANLPEYLGMIAQFLGGLVVLATVIARITPSKSDDEKVGLYSSKIFKIISYLPTIGINPHTQKLKEAYEDLAKNMESESVQ